MENERAGEHRPHMEPYERERHDRAIMRSLPAGGGVDEQGIFKTRMESVERELLSQALREFRGSIGAAARHLGISPRMIRYKLKKLGIDHRLYAVPGEDAKGEEPNESVSDEARPAEA